LNKYGMVMHNTQKAKLFAEELLKKWEHQRLEEHEMIEALLIRLIELELEVSDLSSMVEGVDD
jgi:hypothetical protein